jgi:hypothetical protein
MMPKLKGGRGKRSLLKDRSRMQVSIMRKEQLYSSLNSFKEERWSGISISGPFFYSPQTLAAPSMNQLVMGIIPSSRY